MLDTLPADVHQLMIPGIGGILPGELIVDGFCGDGGMSKAIEETLGRSPDIGINHSARAIRVHELNHPTTKHYHCDIHEVDPHEATQGQPVGLAHFSPDCTHFSRARGCKPVSKKLRSLAWVLVQWAAAVAPRVMTMENVEEFTTWGPTKKVRRGGKVVEVPDPDRLGETYQQFLDQMAALGYAHRVFVLHAHHYGANTTRKRLFIVFRRDGMPIGTPQRTHGPDLLPYREAAECIDFSLPCISIFDPEERRRHRLKPVLAEKTMARIFNGLERFLLNCKDPRGPYIVRLGQQGGRGSYTQDVRAPLTTITTKAEHCLVTPYLTQVNHGRDRKRSRDLRHPIETITGSHGHALVSPILERTEGGSGYLQPLEGIIGCARRDELVAAFLAKHNGGATGQDAREPLHTIAGHINKAVIACHLSKFYGTSIGSDLRSPMGTITGGAGGGHMALIAAYLIHYYGSGTQWQDPRDPLHTVVSRARHGLVTVVIDGDTYAVVDIGMRMLEPRELALAQGLGRRHKLIGSKRDQVEGIGNSVNPHTGSALLRAQFPLEIARNTPTRRRRGGRQAAA